MLITVDGNLLCSFRTHASHGIKCLTQSSELYIAAIINAVRPE